LRCSLLCFGDVMVSFWMPGLMAPHKHIAPAHPPNAIRLFFLPSPSPLLRPCPPGRFFLGLGGRLQ
jgi:hypothetical protein